MAGGVAPGRTASSGRVGCACPPSRLSGCFYLSFFAPTALCPCHASFKRKSCSCSLCPHPDPQEISYHCCICNLWIRGLSIYYYWLFTIIVDYVNLPPVCLSGWVSEVMLLRRMHWPPLRAPPLCCPGDSGLGHWLGPALWRQARRPVLPSLALSAGCSNSHGSCPGGQGGSCS